MDLDKFIKMSIEDLTTPKPGRIVYGPSYWIVTNDDHVLFYKHYMSPQCNTNKSIVEHLKIDDTSILFIPLAYIPHNCSDYCDC